MYSILCVDDEPALLDLAKIFLERNEGFEVQLAVSAVEGLILLKTGNFDAIVSDYQMPEMDGIVFLKSVRKEHGDIPFILFTGKGREDVAIEAINNGADFYLQKGGDPKSQFVELVHKIKVAVDKKRTENQLDESKQRMADIINFLPDATFAIDLEGRVIAWNRAIEEMTGIQSSDILGVGNYAHAVPFYGERRPILLDLVLNGDTEYEKKYPHITRKEQNLISEIFIPRLYNGNGAYLWFIASPLYDMKGRVVGAIESIRDITERKKVETALEESEQQYRNVVEDQNEFICRFSPNGTHVFVNDAYCRYFELERDEILGHRFRPMIPVEDQERVSRFFASLTPDRPVEIIEHQIIMPDGSIRWQRWSDRGIFDSYGKITEFQSVGRDITEKKEADLALQESGERYRSLSEASHDMIFVIDRSDRITYVNSSAADMLGVPASEVIGRNRGGFFPPEISDQQQKAIRKIFETGEPFRSTGQLVLQGRTLWFDHSLVPVRDTSGDVTQVLGISRDITQQKNIEQSLMESETRYRNVVEDQTELISRFLPDGTHIFANEAYCRYFGLKKEDLAGKRFIPDMPVEDRARMRKFLSSLTVSHPIGTIEHAILMPDGERRWQQWSDRAIFDGAGRVKEYQSVGRDVTGRKNTEIELMQSRMALLREESRLETLVKFYQMNEVSEKDLLVYAIEEGVRMTESTVGYLAFVSEDESVLTMYAWSETAMKGCSISKKPIKYKVSTTGLWGEAVRQGRPVITNDYAAPNPLKKGHPKGHVPITRHMNIPVFDGSRIVLVAGVGNKSTGYNDNDARELTLLMNGLWNVIRRRRAEEALQKSNRQLQLMNNITRHDILNQLTALNGYLELSGECTEAPAQMVEFIEKERKIVGIIEEQLAFMRDYQNVGINEPVWQSVNETVRRVASLLLMDDIEVLYDPREVEVFADPMFEKVFFNLTQNSLNYGGDRMKKIRVSSYESGQATTIVYEDDGKGVTPEDKKNLFKLGFGRHTGFGLHLSREILAITGITITENGEPGKGVRFEITIPRGIARLRAPE